MKHHLEQSERRLTDALRSLAEESAQGAPEQVGLAVQAAFRRRHAQRRTRRVAITALAAFLVVSSLALIRRRTGVAPKSAIENVATTPVSTAPQTATGPETITSAPRQPRVEIHPPQRNRPIPTPATRSFVALPAYAQAMPGEELRIVRVRLSGTALRLLGAPISEAASDRQVLADLVIGQDSTPYAVRLAQP